jgi:glucose/arabinose dehydrogenase
LRKEELLSITLSNEGTQVLDLQSWLVNQFGRLREAIQAADGSVYLTTSNRDGRGVPVSDDDRIIRLIPR